MGAPANAIRPESLCALYRRVVRGVQLSSVRATTTTPVVGEEWTAAAAVEAWKEGWAIRRWIRRLSVTSLAKSSVLAVSELGVATATAAVVVGLRVLTDRKLGTC